MKKFLITVVALLNSALFAALPVTTDGAYQLNRHSKLFRDQAVGQNLRNAQQFGAKAQWSFATHGAASEATIKLDDSEGNDVKLPAGAIITNCLIDVVTQPASYTKSAKLSFGAVNDAIDDLKASALVHTGYLATTGKYVCVPVGTVGTMIKTTSELTLQMRVGSEALTAGKINIWIEYVLSDT